MKTKTPAPAFVPKAENTTRPSDVITGSVTVGGEIIPLDSERGLGLVVDCARYTEGALPEAEVRTKWGLNDHEWSAFASNPALLSAVRTEHERRIFSGECVREAAQRHFAKAPDVLNRLLTDEQVAPRHRIEAARELRQAAASGPDIASGPTEKFAITINLGTDETLIKEVYDRPVLCQHQDDDDGEPS
jgi:hypothetical protein